MVRNNVKKKDLAEASRAKYAEQLRRMVELEDSVGTRFAIEPDDEVVGYVVGGPHVEERDRPEFSVNIFVLKSRYVQTPSICVLRMNMMGFKSLRKVRDSYGEALLEIRRNDPFVEFTAMRHLTVDELRIVGIFAALPDVEFNGFKLNQLGKPGILHEDEEQSVHDVARATTLRDHERMEAMHRAEVQAALKEIARQSEMVEKAEALARLLYERGKCGCLSADCVKHGSFYDYFEEHGVEP